MIASDVWPRRAANQPRRLLPGTLRAELLARGELAEAVLTREDLREAQGLAFFNSLRGWLRALWRPDAAN